MEKKIERIREIELELLDAVHDICEKYSLRYSLAFGTLLGAIRHGGFIPWDDDIDIIMPREDYKKLCEIWGDVAPEEYILQNYNTNNDTSNNFSKIRKNHTTFLQFEIEKERSYHKGIFIDIFPADRVATSKLGKVVQYVACAVNLLYSRGYSSGSKMLIGVIEKILLKFDKKSQIKIRNLSEKILSKWNGKIHNEYMIASTIRTSRIYYPSDIFKNMIKIVFEGKYYYAVSNYNEVLKILYGDFMQLPPKEEQIWKHHPILIDFNHNYEELEKQ